MQLITRLWRDVECSPEIECYGGDLSYLRSRRRFVIDTAALTAIDLFAGIGGLSLGVEAACQQVGRSFRALRSFDTNPHAALTYKTNFGSEINMDDIRQSFGGFDSELSAAERELEKESVDFLLAGPPCQGHSDLNNYTRRSDDRNDLYFVVARAAQVLSPQHIIIENVPGARHDKNRVVERTEESLLELGYNVDSFILDAKDFGVAQDRRRHFHVASLSDLSGLRQSIDSLRLAHRTLDWAISDLVGKCDENDIFDAPGETRKLNRSRIDYLFDNDLFDLPDEIRPDCHKNFAHSYKSVYGRLHWDRPSQTITRGFHSVSMGRYVHPSERRTITAHEAARIQFIPDFYDFSSITSRSVLADAIGNAVPPKLSFVIASVLLALAR